VNWLVAFVEHDLACFDDESCDLEPIDNPLGPKFTHVAGMALGGFHTASDHRV
jgi:hypothetical protein